MPRIKLTQLAADRLTTTGKEVCYWDQQLPGFGIRVSPKGKKTWITAFTISGWLETKC